MDRSSSSMRDSCRLRDKGSTFGVSCKDAYHLYARLDNIEIIRSMIECGPDIFSALNAKSDGLQV
jgi:hypothetical protein